MSFCINAFVYWTLLFLRIDMHSVYMLNINKKNKKASSYQSPGPELEYRRDNYFYAPKREFLLPPRKNFFVVSKSNTSLKFTSLSNVETQVWMHNFSQMSRGPLNRTLNLMWTQAIVERLRFEHIRNKTV